jgi:Transcription factor WhiB
MDAAAIIKRFARCADPRSSYTELFFSEEPLDIARAKAICSRCIARTQCLALAVERQEPCGVWGGEIFVEGVPVAEKRRRGRPPRIPRPALVVNEIPDVDAIPDVA